MFNFLKRKKTQKNFEVKKISLMTRREKFIYVSLLLIAVAFIVRYTIWWFNPAHIPSNFLGSNFFLVNYFLFGLLSFVVFIGILLKIGSWFALYFASKPKFIKPEKNLKVAFLTSFVPGKEPISMLEKTLKAMKKVKYPHDAWVLDEGNSDEVKKLCKKLDVYHFSRKGIKKYNQETGLYRIKTKAGNHNAWRDQHDQKYDIVAQIDMDHVPHENYFERTLGYFRDNKVGLVGMPQVYKNIDNWIAKGAAEQANFFHGPMQQGYYGSDMPFLIGTSHIYRTRAMEEIGGYGPTIVEDHLTGMNFYAKKWKGVFVPEILAEGEGPFTWVDYFNQQMRWSYGLFEIFFRHTPKIVWKLKFKQKINYVLSQLFYFSGVAVVVGILLTVIYLMFGINSASMNFKEWVSNSLPVFIIAIIIQIYTHRFSINPKKEPIFGFTGMFLALGANVIYALAFIKFVFRRKLKYMVTKKGESALGQEIDIRTFLPHLFLVIILSISFAVSIIQDNSALQIRAWAIFNIVTLSLISLSMYLVSMHQALVKKKRLYSGVKYGTSFAALIFIILAGFATYHERNRIAFAIRPAVEESISGKVLPSTNGAYLGISIFENNDINQVKDIQRSTNKNFKIVGYYQSWGGENSKFDRKFADEISQNNSIPLITWEPWMPVGGYDRSEAVIDQDEYRLKNIIDGKYDNYIIEYAIDIKEYKKPVMIRFAHEMNGNWYPWGSTFNTPEEYVLAWRHVHEIFDGLGATNVTWVWSPNEIYENAKVPNANNIDLFYPGEDYVDWVGFSSFNWANNYNQTVWLAPSELYEPTINKLEKINKPIIITETGSASNYSNTYRKSLWISELASYLKANTNVKGVVWFNIEDNGVNWKLNESKETLNSFKNSFNDPYFQ